MGGKRRPNKTPNTQARVQSCSAAEMWCSPSVVQSACAAVGSVVQSECGTVARTPSVAIQITHPMPRLARWRCKEVIKELAFVQPKVGDKCVKPYCILPYHGERCVDAVQRHPVDLSLPPRPVPPRRAVPKGACSTCSAHVLAMHRIVPTWGKSHTKATLSTYRY